MMKMYPAKLRDKRNTPLKMNGWNQKISQLERKIIFQSSIFEFHVNFPECIWHVKLYLIRFALTIGNRLGIRRLRCGGAKSIPFSSWHHGDPAYVKKGFARLNGKEGTLVRKQPREKCWVNLKLILKIGTVMKMLGQQTHPENWNSHEFGLLDLLFLMDFFSQC